MRGSKYLPQHLPVCPQVAWLSRHYKHAPPLKDNRQSATTRVPELHHSLQWRVNMNVNSNRKWTGHAIGWWVVLEGRGRSMHVYVRVSQVSLKLCHLQMQSVCRHVEECLGGGGTIAYDYSKTVKCPHFGYRSLTLTRYRSRKLNAI